jgi:predicted lysophospholipase L1 biosynthesis ABC-type transport system permease subunit
MGFREFMLKWILPRDEETLHNWLVIIESFNVVLSLFVLALLVLTLIASELIWSIKFGVVLVMFVIGLSTLNVMQYLLAIEFNTRKKDILKRRR